MSHATSRSLHRARTIAAEELRTHLGGPLLWALVGLAGLATATVHPTALIPSSGAAEGAARLFINSPFAVAQSLGLVSFFVYSFFAAILAGRAVLRDDEHRISELLRSTPLTSAEYIAGKVAGVAAALGLALALHLVFVLWLVQLAPGWNPGEVRGPFHLAHFVLPALLFAAPGIWFSAGLAFAVGARTRQPMLVLAVPTVLFLLTVYVFNSVPLTGLAPAAEQALMVLDPSGLRWLRQTAFAVDRGAAFYNSAPLGLDGTFLLCRLFTLGLPLLAVLGSIRHHRAGALSPSTRRAWPWRRQEAAKPPGTAAPSFRPLGDLRMTRRPPGLRAGTWTLLCAELRELRAQPGIHLFLVLVLAMVGEFAAGAEVDDGPVWLTAGGIATGTLPVITFLGGLLLLFSTVESARRATATRFDALLYSTPVRTGALLLGQGLAQVVLAGTMLVLCVALSLALLAAQGSEWVEIRPFVLVWGGLLLPSLLLWSAFVAALYALVRSAAATLAAGLGLLLLSGYQAMSGGATWVTNWTLTGALRWSDLGTFSLNGQALALNRLLALGLALLCAALAVRSFARRIPDAIAAHHRRRPAGLLRGALRLTPFALVPLAAGGILAARIANGFQGEAAAERARAYWRQNVATWEDVEPAAVRHVDVRIDLEPRRRSAVIAGTFDLVNRTAAPMHRLPFTVGPSFGPVTWTLDGTAARAEDRSGLHVLTPRTPLPPGGTVRAGFAYRAVFPRGFTRNGGGVEQFVLPSGVALHTLRDSFLPVPGFVAGRGLDADHRPDPPEDVGTTARPRRPAIGAAIPFTTRIEVTAPSAYTVNSIGWKTAERTQRGRTTVVWESRVPVRALNVVAGRWAVRRKDGAAVFHHPAHAVNVDEMLNTLAAARRRYADWFHPYPWPELRLSEFPDEIANAQGFPTNIPFSEGVGFLARSGPGARAAFTVTAHEAAHQWWGNLLTPGDGPGADVLIEGMAHYSALLLHESELGPQSRIAFATRLETRYTEGRRRATERPLVASHDAGRPGEATVVYDKGAWALWMLHNHLGRDRMLAGLQTFIRRHRTSAPEAAPGLTDLLETLRPLAPDAAAYQAFLDQWFLGIVLPEIRLREARAVPAGPRWTVSVLVENVGTGTVDLDLAAMRGTAAARQTVRLAPGQPRRVTWSTPFRPEQIVADPEVRVLQLHRERAVAPVGTPSSS